MRHILLIIILIAGLMVVAPARATSLFDEEGCDLFTADTASEIGDLVTIVISETTSASNRASTETSKSLNTDGELSVDGFLQWIAGFPETIAPIEDLTFTPSEEFGGDGRVTTQGTFTTRFTATVVDILPNGNLVIEGTRTIDISEDTADLVLKGVIQQSDLTIDNTVQSNQIAELEITYDGEGIIADRQHDGILSRIFNFFF
ncbi:MAG: flagellar basal body L-ring protein FlgH [bacterium]|nr:flagellar basal body L-ring protein FlgH [bacterium]